MLYLYLSISILFLTLIVFVFSIRKGRQKNSLKHESPPEAVTLAIPFSGEVKQLTRLLTCIEQDNKALLHKVIVVDDSAKQFDIESNKYSFKIEVIHHNKKEGKTKALISATEQADTHFILFVDVDMYWEKEALHKILSGSQSKDKLVFLPFTENFKDSKIPYLQWEDLAIKLFTSAGNYINKPVLLSSAVFMADKQVALELLKTYKQGYGWDMYVLKNHPDRVLLSNHSEGTILTDGPENYISYLKQRSRWLSNGIKYPSLGLSFVGILVSLNFFLDTFILLWGILFLDQAALLFVSTILTIKLIFNFLILRRLGKESAVTVKFSHIFCMQFLYSLNIVFILIFLTNFLLKRK